VKIARWKRPSTKRRAGWTFPTIIVVADPVTMPAKEITLEEANRFNLQADVGDELLFQIFLRR